MNSTRWTRVLLAITVGMVCLTYALSMSAQVQTQTSTSTGPAAVETTVERGVVVFVNGNDLIVKMEDGSLRHFPNVSESVRVSVDGRELGIHDLKVGMKLERTVTTITVPKTITTVKSVTGTVWQIMPPASVTLRMEDNSVQQFKIPKGQKFSVDGQMVDAWGLKKGMKVSATKIVEVPETVVEQQRHLAGTMPPPPPPPPADQPILVAVAQPPATPAAPTELPKTGSFLPLIGLLGILSLAASVGLRVARS